VPCTIKEALAVEGMPHTAGLIARRGLVAERDATAVARLREAGAIVLGVSNVSELCLWMEAENRVYGRTNNPYDAKWTAGGSSGGEGALVGAGATPFGLGSDFGGSIRLPAFFCGVFGHKPSAGLVPATGHYPPLDNTRGFLTIGPLARDARDLHPLLQVLAGPDGYDRGCTRMELADPDRVKVNRLGVLDVADDGGRTAVARGLCRAQRGAAARLAFKGCDVERARISLLREAREIWLAMVREASDRPLAEWLGPNLSLGRELGRWAFGRSDHTFPVLATALLERAPEAVHGPLERMLERGRMLREELLRRLGDHAVMLYPSYPQPAPRHGHALLRPAGWSYTAIFNVMGLPSTQVPLGLDSKGRPLGMQVVAGPGCDHLTLAVACVLQQQFGGWRAPCNV
jgi:fatty acid amide hydrolase 2